MKRTALTRRTPLRALIAAYGTDPACRRCGRPADDGHEPGLRGRGADPCDPCDPAQITVHGDGDSAEYHT